MSSFSRLLTLLCLMLFGWGLKAQNIVPNSSFETNPGCPTGPCEWWRGTSWNNLNMMTGCGAYGTPDYFHTCGAGFSHLPYNGYLTCNPHTGNAVMGFLTWSGSLSPNFREMVSCRLTTPMIVGQSYTVSFWICNAYTPYYGGGSNHIGLDFSTTPLTQGTSMPNLVLLTPEYEIPGVFFSNAWVNYSFTITPTAPWEYITFGNFYSDAATTATLFYTAAPYFRCYYFIDDVSITTTVILPLQLGKPTASLSGDGSLVQWDASEEQGIVRYEVERSNVADWGYQLLGTVPATGEGHYDFADNSLPTPGTWYYRVRAKDSNGQERMSEVATLQFEPTFPLISSLSPNPIPQGHAAQLQLWLPKSELVSMGLYDMQGRLILKQTSKHDAGECKLALLTETLSAGAYLLRVDTRSGSASRKFLVQ